MNITEFLEYPGVGLQENISYLSKPNKVDVVFSRQLAPDEIIPTAFCFPFIDANRIVLTNNRRRGAEVPGGHRDFVNGVLEFPEVAAIRETLEETGVIVKDLIAVGFMRSIIEGPEPEGNKYPFPNSAQQFFTATCDEPTDYIENDECLTPLIIDHKDIENHLHGRGLMLYYEAHRLMFGDI